MDSLLGDFWWKGVAMSGTVAQGRGNPPYKVKYIKYILNLKFTKYNRWK